MITVLHQLFICTWYLYSTTTQMKLRIEGKGASVQHWMSWSSIVPQLHIKVCHGLKMALQLGLPIQSSNSKTTYNPMQSVAESSHTHFFLTQILIASRHLQRIAHFFQYFHRVLADLWLCHGSYVKTKHCLKMHQGNAIGLCTYNSRSPGQFWSRA